MLLLQFCQERYVFCVIGLFMVYYDAESQKSVYISGRERAPQNVQKDMYVNHEGCFGNAVSYTDISLKISVIAMNRSSFQLFLFLYDEFQTQSTLLYLVRSGPTGHYTENMAAFHGKTSSNQQSILPEMVFIYLTVSQKP